MDILQNLLNSVTNSLGSVVNTIVNTVFVLIMTPVFGLFLGRWEEVITDVGPWTILRNDKLHISSLLIDLRMKRSLAILVDFDRCLYHWNLQPTLAIVLLD